MAWRKDKNIAGLAGVTQIYLLGIAIVIGGQLFSWNVALKAGFYSFLVCTLFIGSGYFCLCLCLAEMTSILPFAGGAYGFARVSLGPLGGYLVGCCESIENILYVPAALLLFGSMLSTLFDVSPVYEPIWWLLFYVSALAIQIRGGTLFWTFTCLFGAISLILIVLYCLATPAQADFNRYALQSSAQPEHDSIGWETKTFMKYLPLASWWYVGVEGMPLACNLAKDAVRTVPMAMMLCVSTLIVTALGVLFCSASLHPGAEALADQVSPLSFGYAAAFGISHNTALWLAIPGAYSTAFGFMFIFGRQMNAMAKSGLFPKLLAQTVGKHETPCAALIAGSVIGYSVMLILHHFYSSSLQHLFNVCVLGSFFVYCSMFVSFLVFRSKYSSLDCRFRNHLGVFSAYYGIFVFLVAFVAVAGFQDDGHVAVSAFSVLIGAMLLYYVAVAAKRQYFSPEEQAVLLVAYIINGNRYKKRRQVTRKPRDADYALQHQNSSNNLSNGSTSPQNSGRGLAAFKFEERLRSLHRMSHNMMGTPVSGTSSAPIQQQQPQRHIGGDRLLESGSSDVADIEQQRIGSDVVDENAAFMRLQRISSDQADDESGARPEDANICDANSITEATVVLAILDSPGVSTNGGNNAVLAHSTQHEQRASTQSAKKRGGVTFRFMTDLGRHLLDFENVSQVQPSAASGSEDSAGLSADVVEAATRMLQEREVDSSDIEDLLDACGGGQHEMQYILMRYKQQQQQQHQQHQSPQTHHHQQCDSESKISDEDAQQR